MKTLAKRDFDTPLQFEDKLTVQWSRGITEIVQTAEGLKVKSTGSVCCEQEVTLEKPHVVDHAHIVQLDPEEAGHLGLKTALGVVQGRKLI